MRNLITDVPGVKVGSAHDARAATGVTVAIFDRSCVASISRLGGALAAVNAVGMATVGDSKHFWAAPYEQGREFGGHCQPEKVPAKALEMRFKGQPVQATATTIAMVATDAVLTKAECKRLAIMANDGLARALRPVHAPNDGDTVFAVSTGHAGPVLLTELGAAAADCLARSVAPGVYEAAALPYATSLPDYRGRFGG